MRETLLLAALGAPVPSFRGRLALAAPVRALGPEATVAGGIVRLWLGCRRNGLGRRRRDGLGSRRRDGIVGAAFGAAHYDRRILVEVRIARIPRLRALLEAVAARLELARAPGVFVGFRALGRCGRRRRGRRGVARAATARGTSASARRRRIIVLAVRGLPACCDTTHARFSRRAHARMRSYEQRKSDWR
jgi:hypothetical protein